MEEVNEIRFRFLIYAISSEYLYQRNAHFLTSQINEMVNANLMNLIFIQLKEKEYYGRNSEILPISNISSNQI